MDPVNREEPWLVATSDYDTALDSHEVRKYVLFMGSTTVHIPDEILGRIDAIARRRGTGRDRVVLASLEAEITRDSGAWPDAFFNLPTDEELRILDDATREIEDVTANLAYFSRIAALTPRQWRGESA